jgi:hypothetical protein
LLETHNENSAPTITAAREIENLDNIDWVIACDEILPETIFAEKQYEHVNGRETSECLR